MALAHSSIYNGGKTILMPSQSIEHDDAPVNKESIRGHCYVSQVYTRLEGGY